MSLLSQISSSPMLIEYAQGAAQSATQPVADFLAPTVPVGTAVGRFKKYTESDRFKLVNTARAVGGRATEIGFTALDANYNCQLNGLDFPFDLIETQEEAALENMLQAAATECAAQAALTHEFNVINLAMSTLGGGQNKTWTGAQDPISDLDNQILTVIKAAKYGSLMGVGVLFGATAWM